MGLVNEVRWSPRITALMARVPEDKKCEAERNLRVAALQAAHLNMMQGPSRTGRYTGTFLAGNPGTEGTATKAVWCRSMVDTRNHIMVIKLQDETWRAY